MSILLEIKGKTVVGKGIGRTLGFPTINISYNGQMSGVFVGKVFLDGREYVAAVNLGGRPTIDDEDKLCEVHLLNWSGNVTEGTELKVQLLEKIRNVQKFKNLDELKGQIAKDVERVRVDLSADGQVL